MKKTRRSLLQQMGLGAALAPFVPLLQRERDALGGTGPRRLLLLWIGNGPWLPSWTPGGSETSFTLGEILKPFERHKSKMIVLSGVNKLPGTDSVDKTLESFVTTKAGYTFPTVHTTGCPASWTAALMPAGTFADPGNPGNTERRHTWPDGPSVDQYIAARLGLKTLTLGVLNKNNAPSGRMIYKGAGLPVSPEGNPFGLFDRIFGDLGLSDAERMRIKNERRSVLDLVKGDIGRIRSRVPKTDLQKIDVHLDAVRKLEQDLQNATIQCQRPTLGAPVDPMRDQNVPDILRAHVQILSLAFSCDLVRIASLQMGEALWGVIAGWPGVEITSGVPGASDNGADLHGIGHHTQDSDGTLATLARQKIVKADSWFSEEIAKLLDSFEEKGVMENTVVAYDRELSGTNYHSTKSSPFVLFEGPGGYFKTGRWVRYTTGGELGNWQGPSSNVGQPHSKLLVSLCHSMGLEDVKEFGNAKLNAEFNFYGPLPNLTA